jgi:hypothetical protein
MNNPILPAVIDYKGNQYYIHGVRVSGPSEI